MRHWPPSVVVLVGLVVCAGCQAQPQRPAHDLTAVLKDQVEAHEAYVALLQTVHDDETMKSALPRLAELGQASAERGKRLRELLQSSPAPPATAGEWQERLQKAMTARLRERQRIRDLPGGEAYLQRLDSLGELHQAFSQ
jgi:hypothetical protein